MTSFWMTYMSRVIFEAEISRPFSAPLILKFQSIYKATRIFNVSDNTVAKALLGVRRVNSELVNAFIAGVTSRYAGELITVKLLEGIPKIFHQKTHTADVSVAREWESYGKVRVQPLVPNLSTAKSKYKLVFFERNREVGRCSGVPQALRILMEHYPGDLRELNDEWEFTKATMRMRNMLKIYGATYLNLNDSVITIELEE